MSRIGPTLPPSMRMPNEDEQNSTSDDDGYYGPALPTHLKPPPTSFEETVVSNERTVSDLYDESSSDEVIGPIPVDHSDVHSCSAIDIDKRSLTMKRKLLGEDNEGITQPKREDWMIELPEIQRKNFGLGPRSFNRTDKPECVGRDQWTSTPTSNSSKVSTSKEKDNRESEMRKQYFEEKRNKKLEKIVSEYDKKTRSESLLKAHQKELKSKNDMSSHPKERKPFDRDEDLKLNKLDDAKKKALIKRSQELNSKFKTGNQKFL